MFNAIGRKLGLGIFGKATTVDVFHRVGVLRRLKEDLKMSANSGASCSAQCCKTLPQILSGPGLFHGLQPLKR